MRSCVFYIYIDDSLDLVDKQLANYLNYNLNIGGMQGQINGNIKMLCIFLTIKELVIWIKANDFLIDNLCLDAITINAINCAGGFPHTESLTFILGKHDFKAQFSLGEVR